MTQVLTVEQQSKKLDEILAAANARSEEIKKIPDLESRLRAIEENNKKTQAELAEIQGGLRQASITLPGVERTQEAKDFSLRNLLAYIADPTSQSRKDLASKEISICRETFQRNENVIWERMKRFGDLKAQTRAMDTLSDGSGGALIADELMATVFPAFYKNTVVAQLGARLLTATGWPFRMNRVKTKTTAGHHGEGAAPTASDMAFEQVTMRPRYASALSVVTNDLLMHSTPSFDSLLQDDMAMQVNIEVDRGVLVGDDTDNEPLGLFLTSGLNDLTINGSLTLLQLKKLLAKERVNDAMNLPGGKWGYLFHPAPYDVLMQERLDQGSGAGTGDYVFKSLSEKAVTDVVGYPIKTTSLIPTNVGSGSQTYGAFGNWEDLAVVKFGGVEIRKSTEATVNSINLFEKRSSAFMVTVGYDSVVIRGNSFTTSDDINQT